MPANIDELALLERRIDDVRRALDQARLRGGWFGGAGEQDRILALLAVTLNALEARKAALKGAGQ